MTIDGESLYPWSGGLRVFLCGIYYAESVVQRSPGLPDEGGLPWDMGPSFVRTLKGFRSVEANCATP
jgi:hypothetical protein